MRKPILFFAAMLLSIALCAQSAPVISGFVRDAEQKPLSSVSVSLLRGADSVLVKLALTDKDGRFQFENIKPGLYMVMASPSGFQKKLTPAFDLSDATVEVPALVLQIAAKSMKGVVVQAKRPLIETKADKTIVNVDASPSNAGATALDVLEKSPGINVDENGNISLKGKQGVVVMVDGKPAYLSPSDLAEMLKNMPASALDQIEIMTNPSAKYDASGNSGIINIKTKKGRNNGLNGSIMAGFTSSVYKPEGTTYLIPKSQNSININYRHNKINLFGSFNPNIFNGRNFQDIHRAFLNGSGNATGYSDQVVRSRYGNHNEMLKLGFDWFADRKNVYGMVVSGFLFKGHPTPTTETVLSNSMHQPQSSMESLTQNRRTFSNLTSNFNWKHNLDTAGQNITADLDYVHYNNTARLLLTTNFFEPDGHAAAPSLYLNGNIPSLIDIYAFKSDYTLPLHNGSFEAGIKSSYVHNDNLVDYSRETANQPWVPDSRSNHFLYDEGINAAYANLNRQAGKWNFQAGLRLENTSAKGHQLNNDSTFHRNFTNLFHSVFVSYTALHGNQISFSYGRRITRPNYHDLNPFTYFLDSLTYYVGNPYLLPQFSHNFELTYAYKGKYVLTFNYNVTSDVIAEILQQNTSKQITYNTPENVAHFVNMGIAITLPLTVAKWWNVNLFSNLYNNHYSGYYNTAPINISRTAFMANFTTTFTLTKSFSAELSGFYRSRNVDELFVYNPTGQMTIGLQKQVIKGKGTLRLAVRDPFAWQKYSGYSRYGDIDYRESTLFDSRQVTLNLTYRFGKSAPLQQRRHTGGAQDEQSRVGNGGN